MKVCFIFLMFAMALSGCAIGPLVSHETARTVGRSRHEFVGGFGTAGFVAKWNYGLTENLDMGLHWESLSVGLRAKYAFLNRDKGWSFATALGTGSSIGAGTYYSGDLMASYLSGSWEPYGTLRFVHVKNDPVDFKDKDTGQIEFTVPKSQYDYGQVILGNRYWFSSHWLLSLEVSSPYAISSGLKIGNDILTSGALGYRF
ncbi:MAG: hypothetical protein KF789_06770 [Bdellovibrionaceae bacterium]|nr:hypothetical protein [Pseudobdellovibrionaceae bacterium]